MTRTGSPEEVLATLRAGKRELRERRRGMTLAEKVDEVVKLQRIVLPAIRARRALKPWERVWPVRAGSDRATRRGEATTIAVLRADQTSAPV